MRGWPLIKLLPQKTNFQFVKYARAAGVLSVGLGLAAGAGPFALGALAELSAWAKTREYSPKVGEGIKTLRPA